MPRSETERYYDLLEQVKFGLDYAEAADTVLDKDGVIDGIVFVNGSLREARGVGFCAVAMLRVANYIRSLE